MRTSIGLTNENTLRTWSAFGAGAEVLAEKIGPAWSDTIETAFEVVVFGSRAAGVATEWSDLDLLCVGANGRRVKRDGIDLIRISRDSIKAQSWLGSELAGHVSRYGVWIKGDGEWRAHVSPGEEAIGSKERRIVSLIVNVDRAWSRLHPIFRSKYRTTIRRELQRLQFLREAHPIPPTPNLDAEWNSVTGLRAELMQMAQSLPGVVGASVFAESLFDGPPIKPPSAVS